MKRDERCSISGSFGDSEIPLLSSFLYLFGEMETEPSKLYIFALNSLTSWTSSDPLRRPFLAGSLTGAVHLSNGNAGVLRQAQRGQKPRVEQKGKSSLDFDFQYEYRPRKRGLSILLTLRVSSKRCQKSYHRDNWLVAAKRP